ncbi:MAG: hypothetical protein ABIA67_04290 [Candidatus Margulisiibacteriota bacterium]
MTAKIPMITPSMVKKLRILARMMSFQAMVIASQILIVYSPSPQTR